MSDGLPPIPIGGFGDFVKVYDAAAHPGVKSNVFLKDSQLWHDTDKPTPIEMYINAAGEPVAVRVHLDGYVVVPVAAIEYLKVHEAPR